MMEKVKVEWNLEQHKHLQLLEDGQKIKALLQNFKGEVNVIRYPQTVQDAHFLGIFIQHHPSHHSIQLLVKASIETFEVLDATFQCKKELEDAHLVIELQLDDTEGTLSSSFWSSFYTLEESANEQRILAQLESWSMYLEYIAQTLHYPYSVDAIEKMNEQLTITLYETPTIISDQQIQTVWIRQGGQMKPVGTCQNVHLDQKQLFLQDSEITLTDELKEIYLYNVEDYHQLLVLRGRLQSLSNQHAHHPQIHHPLLNPHHTKATFSGLTMMEEDMEQAVIALINRTMITEQTSMAVCIKSPSLTQNIIENYMNLLPIGADGHADEAIHYVKKPLIEKNAIEMTALANTLSEREEQIQQQAIRRYNEKLQQNMNYVTGIEQAQHNLKEEEEKNNQKIIQMQEAIQKYESEQEQLAFHNDQLMQERFELEDTWHEQQQQVKKLHQEKEDKIKYYQDLEEQWLLFNQEIPSYTENIEALKKIEKSQLIIKDCEEKMACIQKDQQMGSNYAEQMINEYQLFLTNQQVEYVQTVIQKIKKTADFLNIPIDLQFASSYAELTQIYLEKFNGIEFVEERLTEELPRIEQELQDMGIIFNIPAETHYHYDRQYTEDQLRRLIELLNNKPRSLGINYKSKNRWKEQIVEIKEKLQQALSSMRREKMELEQKLMTQLEYAERIEFRFNQDIRMLEEKMVNYQERLEEAKTEYVAIIQTANQDISKMRQSVKLSENNTSGRSQQYETLEDLENARKQFKSELLSKYDVLEKCELAVEEAEKYVRALAIQYEEKSAIVLENKEEMNIQMDLLQHDIMNSKAVIEQTEKLNGVIRTQQEALVEQHQIFKAQHQTLFKEAQSIQIDVEKKAMHKQQNRQQQQAMKKWHDQLTLDEYKKEWYRIVQQKSRLRFVPTIHTKSNQDVFLLEDDQYTWLDLLLVCEQQKNVLFVTTNLAERTLFNLPSFERYLAQQSLSFEKRKAMIQHLQVNPFKEYVEIYERHEQPYVIEQTKNQLSM